MSIPLSTTTISVWRSRQDNTLDAYDTQPAREQVMSGLRAHIGSPAGSANVATGDRTVVSWALRCDPFDFLPDDQVVDDGTGDVFDLLWSRRRSGLGLDHTVASLRQVQGAA